MKIACFCLSLLYLYVCKLIILFKWDNCLYYAYTKYVSTISNYHYLNHKHSCNFSYTSLLHLFHLAVFYSGIPCTFQNKQKNAKRLQKTNFLLYFLHFLYLLLFLSLDFIFLFFIFYLCLFFLQILWIHLLGL